MAVHWHYAQSGEDERNCREHRRKVLEAFQAWRKRNPNASESFVEQVAKALCLWDQVTV